VRGKLDAVWVAVRGKLDAVWVAVLARRVNSLLNITPLTWRDAALRGFNKSRVGKKFNRSKAGKKFNRGIKKAGRGIRKLFRRRRRCFSPETLVKLQDGNEVAMKDLKLGDVLINGSIVNGVMNILNETNPYYKIHSSELDRDIFVTGSHYIKDGKVYKAVKNFSGAEVTTKIDREVSCLITSDHKIPVGEFVFWDWEDDKIQP
jgi:hypothetical protein